MLPQGEHDQFNPVNLTRFVLHEQRGNPEAKGDLTMLLASIQLACKAVESCIRRAGISNLHGLAGDTNVQGEEVKKLDVVANTVFKNALKFSEKVSVLVTEEEEDAIILEGHNDAKYVVTFDPLDGSSNIDANVSVGSIFAVYRRSALHDAPSVNDALQPGSAMVVAGYAMYGSATNLVLTTGKGVNGFTLDPTIGEFVLTHQDIRIPTRAKIYSCNEGNSANWDEPTTKWVHSMKYPTKGSAYSARYIGSMVADVHRTLLYGGVFAYPADKKSPEGKLRLLYECNPMAFLIEQAGGKATTGRQRILDIIPKKIHQRVPIFIGSAEDITEVEALYAAHAN